MALNKEMFVAIWPLRLVGLQWLLRLFSLLHFIEVFFLNETTSSWALGSLGWQCLNENCLQDTRTFGGFCEIVCALLNYDIIMSVDLCLFSGVHL